MDDKPRMKEFQNQYGKPTPYFSHPCESTGCGKEGCIGVGVSLLAKRFGRWFCTPHYQKFLMTEKAHKEAENQEIKPFVKRDVRQGRLL